MSSSLQLASRGQQTAQNYSEGKSNKFPSSETVGASDSFARQVCTSHQFQQHHKQLGRHTEDTSTQTKTERDIIGAHHAGGHDRERGGGCGDDSGVGREELREDIAA